MRFFVTKQFEFCAAHALLGHRGECANVHGHNYKVEVTVMGTSDELDRLGIIMDFADIKRLFGTWIDTHLDHATICSRTHDIPVEGKKYLLPDGVQSSAESLAAIMFSTFQHILKDEYPGLRLSAVKVQENERSWVSVCL